MPTADPCICPNSAEVAAKVIDGEAILINLSNGMYYSMDLVGGLVWQLIEARRTVAEIVDGVCAHYEVERQQADADVRALIAQLTDARLVLVGTAAAASTPTEAPAAPPARLAYRAPGLNAYHDMAELLALDPPHPSLTDTLSRNLVES